jgi:hypothetical protein
MPRTLYPSLQQPTQVGPVGNIGFPQTNQPYLRKQLQTHLIASGNLLDPFPRSTPEFIGPDKWMLPFGERLHRKTSVGVPLQQFLAYSESAQFPEVVYIDKYLYPFGLPVWHKPRLRTALQMPFLTGAHAIGNPYARGYVIC